MRIPNNETEGYLKIHRFVETTHVLGPGTRSALWLQGCLRNCPNCMSQDSRRFDIGELVTIESLIQRIEANGHKELTISGGEPFLQASGLARLCENLHQNGIGVIMYTGYRLEDLEASEDEAVLSVLRYIDILIDGDYVDALNDGRSQIGSANQRLLVFTSRYTKEILEETYGYQDRNLEIVMDGQSAFVIGVPTPEDFDRIKIIFDSECDKK